ncbi:hypothetical protein O1611_g6641 [Lasiodiplodia mahajangana]|uniref:Uncharacterized protein n=1 Tax=Lasiodiplodia mahajangana TaxID=1108764 RepID=A0ACC2JHK1_9PEZI|nr:hypothetical protein O1611_g6641 [Lasiodiplodia mahajangana]
MPIRVVLGAQWEGQISRHSCAPSSTLRQSRRKPNTFYAVVYENTKTRRQGGHNAGHSIVANGVPYSMNFIGSDVPSFFSELKQLDEKGLPNVYDRILVSDRVHINFDLHAAVDGLEEVELGADLTVNGPSYSTKAARSGIRLADVFDQELFETKLRRLAHGYKARYGDLLKYDVEEEIGRFRGYRTELAKYAIDGLSFMHSAQTSNMNVIIEGANAVMLDISMGSYPYVTSSNTTISGIIAGLTLNPKNITETIGVVKAWSERNSRRLAENGEHPQAEDVAVAGSVCQHLALFSISKLAVTYSDFIDLVVLDVLDSFETIKIAIAYKDKSTGKELDSYPAAHNILDEAEVVYHEMPGWMKPTTNVRTYYDLPKQAQDYVEYIEKFVGVKVKWIGTGADREAMITRD